MREHLAEGFEYDAWANALWAPVVPNLGDRGADVYSHLLTCHTIWYSRCLSAEELPALPASTAEALQAMARHWQDLIRMSDPTAFASYETKAGDNYFNMVEDIARHVINHGSYHRGELRALAESAGVDWPETDFIRFKREKG